MIKQYEINNIGFKIKPLIIELCNANVITQRTIGDLCKKTESAIAHFLNRQNTNGFYKKTLISFYHIKDEFYKICIDSIEARKMSQKYIDIVDDIMVELEKLKD
jgi:hypothetical protein